MRPAGRAAVVAGLLLGMAAVARAQPGADYAPGSTEWNGLSRLLDAAQAAGCPVRATEALDWSELEARDVLWFVYPRANVDARKLLRWLASGGRAVIADDFGGAATALESLKIRRAPKRFESSAAERYNGNPRLPIARAQVKTALGQSTELLVSNHAAWFQSPLPATFAFQPGAALVIEGQVDNKGPFVAIADPSVLINNMLEIEGNRAFARALVMQTCRPGDRITLVTQTFTDQGEPRPLDASPPDPSSPFQKFNRMMGSFNDGAKGATSDPRALAALAAFAAVLALVLLAGAFPERALIEDRWTRWKRHEPWGGNSESDALRRPSLAGVPWDYALPASILREEVLERMARALSGPVDFDRLGPQALAARVRALYGPVVAEQAAELWRQLHRIRWRTVDGEGMADDRVGRRQLHKMHQLAALLFDAFDGKTQGFC